MGEPRRRPTQVTMDLLELKQPWLDWCKALSLAPSDAFRQIVARLVAKQGGASSSIQGAAEIEAGQPERPTARKEVSLTPSELMRVEAIAAAEGFSVTKWIIALIRARLTATPQLGQRELELLARSNLQLLAIGRNLNQVAKALNSTPHDRSVYRVGLIEDLEAAIKSHTKSVSDAMTANVERWRIK